MSTRKTAPRVPAPALQPAQPAKLTALQRWGQVKRKQIDAEALDWLAVVAEGILAAASEKDANKRRQAVLNATGIAGKANLSSYVNRVAVWAADNMEPGPLSKSAARARVAAGVGNLADQVDSEAIRKRVERAAKLNALRQK